MTALQLARTRQIVRPLPKAHLTGNRYRLGRFINKKVWYENGAWHETWDPREGAFAENELTYIPDVHWSYASLVYDENHGQPDPDSGTYKVGGPFKLVRFENAFPPGGIVGNGIYQNVSNSRRYVGGFHQPHSTTWANYNALDEYLTTDSVWFPSMSGLGQKAWNKTKPNIQRADGFVFGKESPEIPRMFRTTIRGARDIISNLKTTSSMFRQIFDDAHGSYSRGRRDWKMNPKSVADQFLNYQFGWKPFLNDLKNIDYVYKHSNLVIQKLTEQNGKMVRRKVPLRGETQTTKLAEGNYGGYNSVSYPIHCFPVSFPSDFFTKPPSYELWEDREVNQRAVGRFSFYRPEFDAKLKDYSGMWYTAMRYLAIYGVRINPSNLYSVIPWSWLVDWFTGLGDYIDYLNDILLDSVVCDYCYASYDERVTRRFVQHLPFGSGNVRLEFTRYHETKQREEAASPYYFSLPEEGLSLRQLAILESIRRTRKRPVRS